MWSDSARVISGEENAERNKAQVMIRSSALQWQTTTRGLTNHLSQESTEYLNAKHHFRKKTEE